MKNPYPSPLHYIVGALLGLSPLMLSAQNAEKSPVRVRGPQPATPGEFPFAKRDAPLPAVFTSTKPRSRLTIFPWKNDIVTTVFWVGEKATRNNPVPNTASSWDTKWTRNFGGFDDPNPENRSGWIPKKFIPKQNPFYIALPYNDTANLVTKASAKKHIPWFEETFYREGRTVLKGRWIAIRRGDKVCYGQWEDCGPFETDNWEYVFGDKRPRTKGNGGAGLDVSPAVGAYLGFRWNARCDWRFVELHEIPDGPWKTWGNNNPFALRSREGTGTFSESITKLREMREIMQNPGKKEDDNEPVADGVKLGLSDQNP